MSHSTLRHEYIETNGVKLHCAIQGAEGPLMVFLHGFPEFWYSWRHQLEEFSRDHKVVAPDLRGYNLSDKPKKRSAYAIPELVADVEGLIRKLGYKKATLVAHDWGAIIAWYFTDAHPELVEKLVILNVPHPALFKKRVFTPAQLRKSWYMFFFQLPLLPERFLSRQNFRSYHGVFKQPLRKNSTFTRADLELYKEAAARPGALTAMLNYYRNLFTPRALKRRLKPIQVPTLMIWGEDDHALGKELTYGTEKYVRDFRIKYIPNCSHWVQQEEPALVNKYIREFIG